MVPNKSSFLIISLIGLCLETMPSSSSLQRRKPENVLYCVGRVPPASADWPGDWTEQDFVESPNGLHLLCAAYENDNRNVGCSCIATGIATCNFSHTAAPELYFAFKQYCLSRCSCPASSRSGFGSDVSAEELGQAAAAIDPFTDELQEYVDYEDPQDDWGGQEPMDWTSAQEYYPRGRSRDPFLAKIFNPRRVKKHRRLPSISQKCKGACSNSHSSCGSNPSCRCRANPANGLNSGNPALYSSSCVSALGGKVRRSVMEMPCPCNTTYVSHACCEAKQGLVWEPYELKKGVLMV